MDNVEEFIAKMPKVELHIHLEGAIPLPLMLEFIKRNNQQNSIKSVNELAKKMKYKDFSDFIKRWLWLTSFIKYYDDFQQIAYCVLKELAKQNIKYVEAFCSPRDFHRNGLKISSIIENLIKGKEKAEKDFNIQCKLIVDLVRNYGPKKGFETLEEITPYLGKGVIGIGLGGSEKEVSCEVFEEVFKEARSRGFKLTAHAGEEAGARSIWTAIEKLHIQRIGHAAKAYQDPKLIHFLAQHQIPIEVCPTSNIKTGIFNSIKQHPIKKYFQQNLLITINSDDPSMFRTSLNQEYLLLYKKLNFNAEQLKTLSLNGIKASFLPEEQKKQMFFTFHKEFNALLNENF